MLWIFVLVINRGSVTGVKKVVAVFAVTFNSIITGKYSNFLFITKIYEIKSTISWLL